MTPQLTDPRARARNRARATTMFLQEQALIELQDRVSLVNRTFTRPAIVSAWPDFWAEHWPDATHVEEAPVLALEAEGHDLVCHAMHLHWADDPIGQLIQCRRALTPDGLLLAVFLGGQTLHQLRRCLATAETELTGGLSPRVAPMAEIRDAGALLQRAGLALPVADAVTLNTSYSDAFALMAELRAMGEANALQDRRRSFAPRHLFAKTAELYDAHFAHEGRISATYEMIVLTGWAPSSSQPKALRPGSAKMPLADALGTTETPLKD